MAAKIEFEEALIAANQEYIANLEKALEVLEKEIENAKEVEGVCTDEWCKSVDVYIDDLYNNIYSIPEPRYGPEKDTEKIRQLRQRIKDLYAEYKAITKKQS